MWNPTARDVLPLEADSFFSRLKIIRGHTMVFVCVTLKHLEKLRKNKIALVSSSFLSIKADYFGGGEYK